MATLNGYDYVGNPDYRGWLSATGRSWALPFVGNDGGVNQSALNDYSTTHHQNASDTAAGLKGYYDQYSTYIAPAWNQTLDAGGSSYPGSATSTAPKVDNTPYIDLINSSLNRLPGQLDVAKQNIQRQYDTNNNELESQRGQAQNTYDTGSVQNKQQFVTNKGQVNSQASSGLQSLLRVLGSRGAGGSSAALFAAPNAVSQVAEQQLSGAKQNFGQNQVSLDSNWNNYVTDFGNEKKKLADWLTMQNQGAESNVEQTRQGLLQQLLGLQPTVQAAQPFVDQINQSAAKVDQLSTFNPQYNGTRPVYQAPSVSSYTVNQPGAPVLGRPSNNTSALPPALAALLGLKDKQQQPSF